MKFNVPRNVPSIMCTVIFLILGVFFPVQYASASLKDGLVGYWTMDGKDTIWTSSTTGTAIDRSGNGNTGTLTNLKQASSTRAGRLGQGIDFNGTTSQKIAIGSPASLDDIETQGGGGMTISAWIYPRTTGEALQGTIVDKDNAATTGNGAWGFSFNGSDCATVNCLGFTKSFNTTVLKKTTISNSISLNKWQHVLVTWDGSSSASNVHMYINGVEPSYFTIQNAAGSKVSDAANNIAINDSVSNREFNGIIDDVRIYNRVLSTTEIQQLYKTGATKLGVSPKVTATTSPASGLNYGLVRYFTLDGKDIAWTATSTIRDTSGSILHASGTNMTSVLNAVPGIVGQGLYFNGVNNILQIGYKNPSLSESYTVAFWVKYKRISGTKYLISNYNGGSGEFLRLSTSAVTQISFPGGSTQSISNKFPTLIWRHIVFTRDSSTGAHVFYVNAASTTSSSGSTGTLDYENNGYLTFGGNLDTTYTPNSWTDATYDDIRIYNRALSAAEIGQLYKQGSTKLGVTPTRTASSTGLSSGLVGHWTFDGKDTVWSSNGTTGTTTDKSGGGNNARLTNMNRAIAPTRGKIGQALRFSSSTNLVYIGTTPNLSNNYSISFWMKSNDSANSVLLSNYNGYGNPSIRFESAPYFNGFKYVHNNVSLTAPQVVPNVWYHFVGTRDATTGLVNLYVNNASTSSAVDTTGTVNFGSNGVMVVGGSYINYDNPPESTVYNGTIDDVRIYNRVLSATEIQLLYRVGQSKTR